MLRAEKCVCVLGGRVYGTFHSIKKLYLVLFIYLTAPGLSRGTGIFSLCDSMRDL